ncbi:MAG: hypothetical protein LUE22_06470 [Oscillospiraceae bacterium]|nr:hypothetical protein [Oscillospiraceae bacterium]
MRLIDIPGWKAIHFDNRTLLPKDKPLFPAAQWDYMVRWLEVEPMEARGHYRAVTIPVESVTEAER